MRPWEIHFEARVDITNSDLQRIVARIEALSGIIRRIPLPPDLRQRLNRLNILRAVRGTTGIEGSDLSEEEVGRVLDAADDEGPVLGDARRREEAEARNANRVMAHIRTILKSSPQRDLREDDVREIHRLTTSGIDYENNTPGEYRRIPVFAGDYAAPLPSKVPELMARFFTWFPQTRTEDHWPECVRAIVAHFYLVSIHPFGDGNGRTSRAAESWLLLAADINPLSFYSLANFYYRQRSEYIEMLDRARWVHNGDLTEMVRFALSGLLSELEAVHEEALLALREIAYRDYAREVVQTDGGLRSKTGDRRLILIQWVQAGPVRLADIRSGSSPLSAMYRGTPKTLTRDLHYLESKGLVVVEGGEVRANLEIMNRFIE